MAEARETSLTGAILNAWSDLRASYAMQRRSADESRLLFFVVLACGLLFIAGLPGARAQAEYLGRNDALAIVLSARLFGTMFILPLGLYGLAALSHLLARAAGGRGDFRGARLALFWSLLVAMPVVMAAQLLAVVAGAGHAPTGIEIALGAVAVAGILWVWGAFLAEAEGFERTWPTRLTLAAVLVATIATIAGIQT